MHLLLHLEDLFTHIYICIHLSYRQCLVLDQSFLSHILYMSVIFLICFLVRSFSILIYCFSYICCYHFSSVLTVIILFLNMNAICQIYRVPLSQYKFKWLPKHFPVLSLFFNDSESRHNLGSSKIIYIYIYICLITYMYEYIYVCIYTVDP